MSMSMCMSMSKSMFMSMSRLHSFESYKDGFDEERQLRAWSSLGSQR